MRGWPWITAGIGLIVIGLPYVQGALLGVWADDHANVSQTMPGSEFEFVTAGLGMVLLVGGVIVGVQLARRGTLR